MRKLLPFIILLTTVWLFASFTNEDDANFTVGENTPVWQVLDFFGEPETNHHLKEEPSKEMVEMGRDLVITGKAKGVKQQSKHFKCISCHNVVQDEGDLATMEAQAKLEYCAENDLPFLQGTSLYGIVNRTSFYNGDYQKKYDGNPRIIKSHKDLREAIQLCAVECAQGRPMTNKELDAVLMYFWSLEFKMGDLDLSKDDWAKIRKAAADEDNSIKDFVKSKYLQAAPATFGITPKDAKAGFPNITGNPENGKLVYDLSCLYCHEDKRYSMYELDNHQMTFQHLKRHIPRYDRYSVYQVSRYGAPSYPGKRAYMPQYPVEKLTDQQLEDLRAYVDYRATGGK